MITTTHTCSLGWNLIRMLTLCPGFRLPQAGSTSKTGCIFCSCFALRRRCGGMLLRVCNRETVALKLISAVMPTPSPPKLIVFINYTLKTILWRAKSFSLSLSLSLTHTHTHIHTQIPGTNSIKKVKQETEYYVITRRTNAQMIHIHPTHRISLQSSSLYSQPLWKSGLLHAFFNQMITQVLAF